MSIGFVCIFCNEKSIFSLYNSEGNLLALLHHVMWNMWFSFPPVATAAVLESGSIPENEAAAVVPAEVKLSQLYPW